jgi:hypothetical protein
MGTRLAGMVATTLPGFGIFFNRGIVWPPLKNKTNSLKF